MTRLAVVVPVLTVAFVGCTTTHPPATKEPDPMVVPPLASSAPPPAIAAEPVIPSAPPHPPLPRHPAGDSIDPDPGLPEPSPIGAACTEPQACGKSGKVALVARNWRNFRKPSGKEPCKTATVSPRAGMNATRACVEGDRVFITANCIICRTSQGEELFGLVPDMTPAQLTRAQTLAGFPEAPLLTTPAAWSSAIAAASAKNGAP